MKKLLLATVAAVALATVGIAQAADGNGCSKQLAASGLPEQNTSTSSSQLAAAGLPIPNTAAGSQLAAVDPNCQN
jgi:hypothetical protein